MRASWLVVAGAALALQSTARAGEELQGVCIRAGGDYGATDDVALARVPVDAMPDASYATVRELEVHGFPEVRGVLMQWEVPQSPVVSAATAVKVHLHITKQSKSTYEVYPLLRQWTPGQATWLSPMEGELWGEPGASLAGIDFDPTPLGRFAATGEDVEIDLDGGANLLSPWSGSPASNFGIIIRNQQAAIPNQIGLDSAKFHSADAVEVGLRPALIISSQDNELILQEGDGGYAGAVDTMIASSAPSNLNGRLLAVEGATFGADEVAEPVVSLLWFDLSSIPARARVVDGGLHLCSPAGAEAEGRVVVDGLSQPWNDREATWTPGALEIGSGRRGIVAAEIDVDGGYEALSLTDPGIALVQEWVWDPRVNHGFVLGSDTDTAIVFRSSETRSADQRPMLCVGYVTDRSLDLDACGCSAGSGFSAAAFALPLLLRALRRRRA